MNMHMKQMNLCISRYGEIIMAKKVEKKPVKKPAKSIKEYVSDRVFDGVRPIEGKRLESLKAKAAKKKAAKKEKFTVTVFTKRGAMSHIKIYEKAGYKLLDTRITDDQVFLTFEDKDAPGDPSAQ